MDGAKRQAGARDRPEATVVRAHDAAHRGLPRERLADGVVNLAVRQPDGGPLVAGLDTDHQRAPAQAQHLHELRGTDLVEAALEQRVLARDADDLLREL